MTTTKRFSNGYEYKKNYLFWADICKYGWDSFNHEILYSGLDSKTAHDIERRLINEWNLLDPRFGYNLWDGKSKRSPMSATIVSQSRLGNKKCLGRVLSNETRAKIATSLSDYYSTHDNPFLGRHHTSEAIEKLRHRVFSEETRMKMRNNHADVSGANNPSAKAVEQYTKDGEFVASYSYAKQAADSLNIDLSSIIKCCRGKNKSAGGFIWKYATKN